MTTESMKCVQRVYACFIARTLLALPKRRRKYMKWAAGEESCEERLFLALPLTKQMPVEEVKVIKT